MIHINKHILIEEPVRRLAGQVQESEMYDILDIGIEPEEFSNAASQIVYRLAYIDYDTERLRFHDRRVVSLTALGLSWKACTATGGSYVSCSDENGTGMSTSLASIFHDPYRIEENEVKDLLDMMNEAYARMKGLI